MAAENGADGEAGEVRGTGQGATGARVTRRRGRTRARLLDAAFTVFAAKGFGRVSIEEVCEAAGYTRGAFYSNFGSLDELFFALYQDRADLISGQVADALAADGPDLDVPAAVDRVTEVLLFDPDWLLVKTDFLVHAARDTTVAEALLGHRAGLRRAIADRLERAAEHAGTPAVFGDAERAAHAVIAAYDGVTTQLLLDKDVEQARSWLRQLLTALLTDGGTDPGADVGTSSSADSLADRSTGNRTGNRTGNSTDNRAAHSGG